MRVPEPRPLTDNRLTGCFDHPPGSLFCAQPGRRKAVHRILHGQYKEPQHPPRLLVEFQGVPRLFRLPRRISLPSCLDCCMSTSDVI
jgi:hypothetical protein